MPRDLKTIPTAQLKTEAKIYLVAAAVFLGLAMAAFLLKSHLGEGLSLAIFFGGFLLGMLFGSIGVGFFLIAIFRHKDWRPEWGIDGLDPESALQEWIRDLQAELPRWTVDDRRWESLPEPTEESLWTRGIKGVVERFASRGEPMVNLFQLQVRLVHGDGRKVLLSKTLGRPRDLKLPRVGGFRVEATFPGTLSNPIRYTCLDRWTGSRESLSSRLRPGFVDRLQERLDSLLSDSFDGVRIPFAFLDLTPQDGLVHMVVYTLPRQTHGGFGSNPVAAECVHLMELLEANLGQPRSSEGSA